MTALKTILIVLGVLFILFIILMLIGVVLYVSTPDIKSKISTGDLTAAALESYYKKISDFTKQINSAVESNQRAEIKLIITKEELNSVIVQMMAEGKLPFKELKVSFDNNQLWTYFELGKTGANAKIGFAGKIGIEKNNPSIKLNKFELGKLPLSESMSTRAEEVINIFLKMQNPLNDLPLELKSIDIINNQLVINVYSLPSSKK